MDSGGNFVQAAKGYVGARWAATDENDDALEYTVEIRGEKETDWKPLRKELKEKYLSWDATGFPDGEYRLRVTASDAPGNPSGEALTTELVSDPLVIDNTPPEISGLAATPSGSKLSVRWKAADASSVIQKAEYSVNGGEWIIVEPVGKLSDSREEEYSFELDRGSGEQVIAVRVTDEYDNQGVAKIVVR
jgi:hypothetical protein